MHLFKTALPLAVSSAMAVSVAGCGDKQANEFLFVALGSIGGAVVGSQIGDGQGQAFATAVGSVLGAYTAQQALWWLDEQDRRKTETALRKALEINRDGEPVNWTNPDNRTSGYAVASAAGGTTGSAECREFKTFVTNGTERDLQNGVACRSADGSWRILPNQSSS